MNGQILTVPHAGDVEKSVLSVLLREEFIDGEESLTEAHFYSPSHRRIFALLLKKRGRDMVSLNQELIATGELEAVGGHGYLSELFGFCPSTGYFEGHLKTLHQYRGRRLALEAALALQEAACDTSDEDSFIAAAGEPMTKVFEATSAAQRAKTKKGVMKTVLDQISGMIKGVFSPVGVTTGFEELDRMLGGLHGKRMWVISGFPTGGKTVLGLLIPWFAARAGSPSLFISLEMPSESIVNRLLVPVSGLPAIAITNPREYSMRRYGTNKMSKEDLRAISEASKLIEGSPIYFEDPSNAEISQVIATIRRYHRKHGVKVVAIDYLQLLRGGNPRAPRDERVADISHALQGLAKELGLTIILLSQQNEAGATKYSTAVSDDADAIISIAQNRETDRDGNPGDDYGKHLGLFIRKDRHYGNTGEMIPLVLDKEKLTFVTRYES